MPFLTSPASGPAPTSLFFILSVSERGSRALYASRPTDIFSQHHIASEIASWPLAGSTGEGAHFYYRELRIHSLRHEPRNSKSWYIFFYAVRKH